MIHPDDAFCYPVCESCRVADVCVKGPPLEVIARENRRAPWQPNQLQPERLKCGCRGLPWPLIKVFEENIEQVLCDRHGWTEIAKPPGKAKSRKTRPEVPGQIEIVPF
jgi:hypothetical protein